MTVSMTISEYLGKKRSGKVAMLIDRRDPETEISLTLTPDTSTFGAYSITAKSELGSQSFRMQYKSSRDVQEMLNNFEEYLNMDTPGKPFEVEFKPPVAKRKPKPKRPATIPAQWRAELRRIKSLRYKTFPQEKIMKVLEARIKADPRKWQIGDGVGWKVMAAGGVAQINRGFAIAKIAAEDKMALITQVADTGLTVTGGYDVIPDEWVPLGDLVRDRKYDVEFK